MKNEVKCNCSIVDLPISTGCGNIIMPSQMQIHKLVGNKYFIDDVYQGDILEVVNRNVKVQLINGSIVELCFSEIEIK